MRRPSSSASSSRIGESRSKVRAFAAGSRALLPVFFSSNLLGNSNARPVVQRPATIP
jgi:hypothetical protein